jgi:hypothetical protein
MDTLDQQMTGERPDRTALVVRRPRRLSQVLRELTLSAEGPITVERIRDAIGDRGFAAMLILFAAMNLLPLPPGSTLVFGIPLMLVSGQMMLGHSRPWLPGMVLRRPIQPARFRDGCDRLLPRLEWLERLVHPRRWPFAGNGADRLIGLATFILAVVVFLPIPLGNWLPACSIALIGLALSERDGLFLAAGMLLGVLSFVVIGLVYGTAGYVAGDMLGRLF